MKRAGSSISEDGDGDDNLLSGGDLPELSVAENNDAEIAEIVDVINNDTSLLPSMMEGYINVPHILPPPDLRNKKLLAKRQKMEMMLPKLNYNLICDRLVGTLHMPLQTPKLGRDRKDTRTTCGICGAKTTIKCSHCGVGMCIGDREGRNCWREVHTKEVLEYNQQPKAERKDRSRQGMALSSSDAGILRNNIQNQLQNNLQNLQQELHLIGNSSNISTDSSGLV